MECQFKRKDGSPCPVPASHHWGPVACCCAHFEDFVWGSIIPAERDEHKPRHIDIVEEYEKRTGRGSFLPGTSCEAKKPGDP